MSYRNGERLFCMKYDAPKSASNESINCLVPPQGYMMPQCTGEQCLMHKIAMKNPKVKEIMDYTMKRLKETDDLKEKLALAIGVDLILKGIADEDENADK